MSVRSTVKAIILDKGKVLLNRCYDEPNGSYYSLPGGGRGEIRTLHDALVRECLEETGYTVEPLRFAALMEESATARSSAKLIRSTRIRCCISLFGRLASREVRKPTENG
jgi:ADP-ribose pyrophosphatase YjhB (NUDIX family)